jgi:hypothetical protein
MGHRRNWDAIRLVAENINAGDRSFWNLTKIPQLPTSGFAAIDELDKRGLIKASFRDNRVEPTEAFWPWLEGVRQAETQQAAQQANAVLPDRHAAANTDPGNLPMLEFASFEGAVGLPHAPAPALVKPRRPRIKRPDLDRVDQMCVKIIDFMNHNGHRLPSSTVRRGVNAHRYPGVFDFALRRLKRVLNIEKEPGTRREWLNLLEVPPKYEATTLPPKRRRYPRRSRGQTPWFQALIAEQELED